MQIALLKILFVFDALEQVFYFLHFKISLVNEHYKALDCLLDEEHCKLSPVTHQKLHLQLTASSICRGKITLKL